MKSKIILFITLSFLSIKPSIANISEFEYCKLLVFVSGCNISSDNKAPPYMKHGGEAACFVALDIAIDHKHRGKDIIEKIIEEQNYERKKYSNKILELKKNCSSSMSALQKCDLGFVVARGIQSIDQCKKLIKTKSILPKSKVKPKQANHIFELKLSKEWKLDATKYNNGFVKSKYIGENKNKIYLEITPVLDKSKFDSFMKRANEYMKERWARDDIELTSKKVVNIGAHKSVSEQLGSYKILKKKRSVYIIRGKNRLAIIGKTTSDMKTDIKAMARSIVKNFRFLEQKRGRT